MVTRRNFMKTMLAACAAPAIVKASSLMKIYVPKQELLVSEFNGILDFRKLRPRGLTRSIAHIDELSFYAPIAGELHFNQGDREIYLYTGQEWKSIIDPFKSLRAAA
jgi:hypothetical protein